MLRRHPAGPVVTRGAVPESVAVDPSSVFNPGAVAHGDGVTLMLRVQTRGRETVLALADSRDGIAFEVRDQPVELAGIERHDERIYHVYDPRITAIEGHYLVTLALDVEGPAGGACRFGVARSDDLERFEFLGVEAGTDVRNGVLFPRRFDGAWLRLDRPNNVRTAGGAVTGDAIVLSRSMDLLRWETVAEIATGRPHYWDEWIGPGTPPVRTRDGWLLLYHGVATHFAASNIYQAGLLLLDLEDPSKVLARSRNNVLEPREPWELTGQVPNVVFPTGLVVRDLDSEGFAAHDAEAFVYYGAADTCVGLARATVGKLLEACRHD